MGKSETDRAEVASAAWRRGVERQDAFGHQRLERDAVVLDGTLPVTCRAAAAGPLELVRRHPHTVSTAAVCRCIASLHRRSSLGLQHDAARDIDPYLPPCSARSHRRQRRGGCRGRDPPIFDLQGSSCVDDPPRYFDTCFIFPLQRNLEWICQFVSFVRHKLVLL